MKVYLTYLIEKWYDFLEEKKLAKRRDRITEVIHFEGATSYRTVSGVDLTKKGWKYLALSLLALIVIGIILF